MKFKKLFATAITTAIVATTMGGFSAIPAFAEETVIPEWEYGTTPNVAITKTLEAPEGVTPPDTKYTFQFTQLDSVDGVDDVISTTVESISLADVVSFVKPSNSEAYNDSHQTGLIASEYTLKTTEGGIDYYQHESGNFVLDSTGNVYGFTKEGVYAYSVVESATVLNADDSTWTDVTVPAGESGWNESITTTSDKYRVLIYTRKDAASGEIYIWALSVAKYETPESTVVGPKKNSTSGGDTRIEGDLSEFEFENIYKKEKVTKPEYPEDSLYGVQKTVTGVSNKDNMDQILWGDSDKDADKFKFTVTMTRSPLYPEDTAYTAKIYKSTTGGDSWEEVTGSNVTFTFDSEGKATQTVYLTHYQKLAFDKLPAGTSYSVEEEDYSDETKSEIHQLNYDTTVNGADGREDSGTLAEEETTSYYINNANDGSTPTGILMNYLPFILIIGMAFAALFGVVIVKGRRRGQLSA